MINKNLLGAALIAVASPCLASSSSIVEEESKNANLTKKFSVRKEDTVKVRKKAKKHVDTTPYEDPLSIKKLILNAFSKEFGLGFGSGGQNFEI